MTQKPSYKTRGLKINMDALLSDHIDFNGYSKDKVKTYPPVRSEKLAIEGSTPRRAH